MNEIENKTEIKECDDGDENEMEYSGSGHLYGNFSDYYRFNGDLSRVCKLKDVLMEMSKERKEEYYILDVGCNSGVLTIELLKMCLPMLSNVHVLGIDIDENLINKAQENIPFDLKDKIEYICCDIIKEKDKLNNYLLTNKINKFSLITCFSTTMWIHIHGGDGVLKEFILFIYDKSEKLIIEPQIWKNYRSAKKRCRRLGIEFPIKEEDLNKNPVEFVKNVLLMKKNDIKMKELGLSEWKRPILYFY